MPPHTPMRCSDERDAEQDCDQPQGLRQQRGRGGGHAGAVPGGCKEHEKLVIIFLCDDKLGEGVVQAAPLLLRVSTDALIKVSSCAAPRPWQRAGSVQSRQGLPPCLLFKTPIINSTALSAPPQDLAAGYMSGKLLLKLEAIGFILTHHTAGELRRAGSECRPSFPWALLLTVLLLVPAVRRRRGNKRRQSFKQASRSPLLARCLPPVLLPHTVSPPPAVPPWQFRPFLSRPTATRAAALPHRPSPAPRPPRPPAPRVLPLPVPPRQPAVAHHLLQHPGAPAVHGGHAAQVQELRGAAAAGGLGGRVAPSLLCGQC